MGKRHNITAIITDKRGMVLSIGKNSYSKTHPMQKKYAARLGEPYKCFMHAEIAAIVKCKDLSKAHTISIIRVNDNGEHMLAKPCPICHSAIVAAGIKNVKWSE